MKLMMAVLSIACALQAVALEFKCEQGIHYYPESVMSREGDYARSMCLVDVTYPVGVTNFATVVNFHGGGLVKGRRNGPAWPKEAKGRDPVAFVSAGYRLLTNATPEQCVGDAAAAVAWTLRNISRYGGDPKKVFVTGVSGGGYLTAMVGMDPKWLAPHGFKPTDLAGIAPLTGQMTKHFNIRKVGFRDDDPQYLPKIDEWAPLAYASTNALPPSCFLTGGRDTEWKGRVEENALLEASLRANGARNCEFHETEGNHGGGVYPSSYFLRDFVMRTCDAGGVARFADGELALISGGKDGHASACAANLQLFWSLRYPGSDVRIRCGNHATAESGLNGCRVIAGREAESPMRMMADILGSMCINPFVARVAIDAKSGKVFLPSNAKHKDASGRKLPDSFNAVVTHLDVREDGAAFTYAPKALPFPATSAYADADSNSLLTARLNQEVFIVERLAPGMYDLGFDGAKVGSFSDKEFRRGVNVALLCTPNQRRACDAAEIADRLRKGMGSSCAAQKCTPEMDDLYERLNAVRPAVSRVTVKRVAE